MNKVIISIAAVAVVAVAAIVRKRQKYESGNL